MSQRMRAMTWNIRSSMGGDDAGPNHDPVDNLRRIAGVIRESGLHIVGLHEVDRYWDRSGGVDQAQAIADHLGMEAILVANWLPQGGEATERVPQYSVAILSRWPFLVVDHLPHATPTGWEPRGGVMATVVLPTGRTAVVVNTHLQVDPPGRPGIARDQRSYGLQLMLEGVSLPGIVTDDFNALPGSPELAAIESRWTDSWRTGHPDDPGYTFRALKDTEPT